MKNEHLAAFVVTEAWQKTTFQTLIGEMKFWFYAGFTWGLFALTRSCRALRSLLAITTKLDWSYSPANDGLNVEQLTVHCFMALQWCCSTLYQMELLSSHNWMRWFSLPRETFVIFDIWNYIDFNLEHGFLHDVHKYRPCLELNCKVWHTAAFFYLPYLERSLPLVWIERLEFSHPIRHSFDMTADRTTDKHLTSSDIQWMQQIVNHLNCF